MRTPIVSSLLLPLFFSFSLSLAGDVPRLSESLTILAPITARNLAIFPVVRSGAGRRTGQPEGAYITLDEGVQSKRVTIRETGTVNRLEVSNQSKRTLFIMAGEMVTGGKQDRIVGVNVTLAPGETRRVPAFCVEKGRWTRGKRFASNKGLVHSKLRQVAQRSKSQREVWREVSHCNDRLGTRNATQSYRFNFSDARIGKLLASYMEPLRAGLARHQQVVGVCVAINGALTGADIYLTPALFGKFRAKLLRSYAIDAMQQVADALIVKGAADHFDRALLYIAGGKQGQALADLSQAIQLDSRQAVYHRTRALLLRGDAKRTQAALADYDRALELDPTDVESRKGRASLRISAKAWGAALSDIQAALVQRPEDLTLRCTLGWLLHQQGQLSEAIGAYTRAIKLAPTNPVAWYNRGLARAALGQRALASDDLTRSAKLGVVQWCNDASTPRRNEQRQSGRSGREQRVQRNPTVKVLLAQVIDRKQKVEPRRVALELSLPRRARLGLAALLADRVLRVAAPPSSAALGFLAEVRRAPMRAGKSGSYQFESKRFRGFGTGSQEARLLHFNCHKK